MNPSNQSEPLGLLFTCFNVSSLGDGNVAAGANVLAAMCFSLSNIQRPGAGVIRPTQLVDPAGTSFLASGSLTEALVAEKVMSHLLNHQTLFSSHVATYHARRDGEMRKDRTYRDRRFEDNEAPVDPALFKVFNGDKLGIFRPDETPARRHLVEHPGIVIDGSEPGRLEQQLRICHQGRPIVHVPLWELAQARKLVAPLRGLMAGRSLDGPLPTFIRGNVAAFASKRLLEELHGDQPSASWIGSLPWLVDDAVSAPERPGGAPASGEYDHATQGAYEVALREMWGDRIGTFSQEPRVQQGLGDGYLLAMDDFLRPLEASWPGIGKVARPVLPSLAFGLLGIMRVLKEMKKDGVNVSAAQLVAFAQYLVGRMVRTRQAMAQTEESRRLTGLAIRLIHKLAEQPKTPRGIIRSTNRLRMSDLTLILDFFEKIGVAAPQDGTWGLTVPMSAATAKLQSSPVIDA